MADQFWFRRGALADLPSEANDGEPLWVNDAGNEALYMGRGPGKTPFLISSGAGNISKVGVPADNQVAVWVDDQSIEGTSDFQFDSATGLLTVAGSAPGISDGSTTRISYDATSTTFFNGAKSITFLTETNRAVIRGTATNFRFQVDSPNSFEFLFGTNSRMEASSAQLSLLNGNHRIRFNQSGGNIFASAGDFALKDSAGNRIAFDTTTTTLTNDGETITIDEDSGFARISAADLQLEASSAGKLAVGGTTVFDFVNTTIANIEPTPVTVRYANRIYPHPLSGASESAALYCRVDPSGGTTNQLVGIYLEVTDEQQDTEAAAFKCVHQGEGDAMYVAAFNSGPSFESASFYNGHRGIISTCQTEQPGGGTDFGNTTLFQAVWGDDGTGGSTTPPNFGVFYSALSLGHSFRVRLQDPLATGFVWGRQELAISEFSLARYRWITYNTGAMDQLSTVATVGSPTEVAPASRWIGSYWNGASADDKIVELRPSMDGSGNPLVSIFTDTVERLRISQDGVSVRDDRINIESSHTPANASDTGTQGDIAWDSDYVYVCVSNSVWKRAPLSTW